MDAYEALGNFDHVPGWLTREEGEWLFNAASNKKVVVEIGCWKGRSTNIICMAGPTVFTVDHFSGSDEEIKNGFFLDTMTQAGRDEALADFIKYMQAHLEAGKLFLLKMPVAAAYPYLQEVLYYRKADMVFIDGAHDAEAVMFDIVQCMTILKKGGLICGHDYKAGTGVPEVVDRLFPNRKLGPGSLWHHTLTYH